MLLSHVFLRVLQNTIRDWQKKSKTSAANFCKFRLVSVVECQEMAMPSDRGGYVLAKAISRLGFVLHA
jgi:hypothetical protein